METLPPVPRLSDDLIALRPLREGDTAAIFEACHDDPDILRWVMRPAPFTREAAEEWVRIRHDHHTRGEQLTFAIAEPASDLLLGAIWLGRFDWEARRAEFGYWVTAGARRTGVATRAVALVSRWAFRELRLIRVQILAPQQHPASQRVAERAGFRNEGLLRGYRRIEGEQTDLVMYSLLRDELP